MSDPTAGNQDESICTNGTMHCARTEGPTDICKTPDGKALPFFNKILTRNNVNQATTRTFIGGHAVWNYMARIGPKSFHVHEGTAGGESSGTYREFASAKSYSRDVNMEGQRIVRAGDETFQNCGNSTGRVFGPGMNVDPSSVTDMKAKLCFLDKIDGQCKHGRKLGKPPGDTSRSAEANYLEVVGGDIVTLTAVRKNLVDASKDAACETAAHGHWRVERTAGKDKEEEEFGPQDELELASKWLGHPLNLSKNADKGKTPESFTDADGNERTYGEGDSRAAAAGEQGKRDAAITRKVTELGRAILYWNAQRDAPRVRVDVEACSGRKQVNLVVRPRNKLTFNLFSDSLKEKLDNIRKAADLGKKVLDKFGIIIEPKLLEQPKLEFVIEYKELTKETAERNLGGLVIPKRYPVQARPAWSIEMEFKPLIGVTFGKKISIYDFAGPLGVFGKELLKHVNVDVSVTIELTIGINPKVTISWDEYDEVPLPNAEFELQLKFSAKLVIAVGIAEFSVEGYMDNTFKLNQFEPGEHCMFTARLTGVLQLGVEATASFDLWCLDVEKAIEWKPEFLKVEYGKGPDGKGVIVPFVPWFGVMPTGA